MDEQRLAVLMVTVVGLGVGAQWLAGRLRIPAIVLLAVVGLVIGPGLALVQPSQDFAPLLRPVVGLCVAIILFEGGLSLQLHKLKEAAKGVRRLVYLGVPLAWLSCSLAARLVGGLSWPVSLVFGSVLVVTGPTVIMPLLRQAGLNRRTACYLKWEAIVNDPIGALLAVLVFQFFLFAGEGGGWSSVLSGVGGAVLSGALLGGAGGWLISRAFLAGLVPEYLKSPVLLGMVLVVFVSSNSLQHEAGLLAVTIMGIVVGNMHLPGIDDMRRFKEYITVMLVGAVFVLLTADLDPASISNIGVRGVALVATVMLLARPLSIMLATVGARMDIRERVLLSWIAPRGIVAAATAGVMGPGLIDAGYADAEALLPLIFAVIFATVFFHGLSIGWVAKQLGLASKHRDSVLIVGASPWSIELARTLRQLRINVLLADSSWHNLRPARLDGVPVFFGEILSDFAEESVEIAHVSNVLAATSNDAYNALVCTALSPEVGRRNIYQLPMGTSLENDPRGVARPLRGKLAFSHESLFENLWRRHVRGWSFYKTRLSDSYTFSDFIGDCPAESVQILVKRADGSVLLQSPQAEVEPESGDTVVCYGPERQPAESNAAG